MVEEYEKCPKCGNEKILRYESEEVTRYYSKTGKCVKLEKGGSILHWGYSCKCGWIKTYTE